MLLLMKVKGWIKAFWNQEADALTMVENLLILVAVVILAIFFQDQLTDLVERIFESIQTKAGAIYGK